VRAAHLVELRSALREAYGAAGFTGPAFTEPVVTTGVTFIRAVHIQELRDAVIDLETS
jgi:hypothetical protein